MKRRKVLGLDKCQATVVAEPATEEKPQAVMLYHGDEPVWTAHPFTKRAAKRLAHALLLAAEELPDE